MHKEKYAKKKKLIIHNIQRRGLSFVLNFRILLKWGWSSMCDTLRGG
nr:MAG TPA: hypothetical protein [Caudoviricetes sp.]